MKIKTNKLVYGHGINDLNEPVTVNGEILKFYHVWTDMLNRCYSDKFQIRYPTYRDCSVCDEWLLLSTFKVWFDINYRNDMSLDKDVLVKGNREYGPDTCRFVPGSINNLLTDAGAIRGDLPLGVTAVRSKAKNGQIIIAYRAKCRDGKGGRPSKTFGTIPEARQWYVMKKKEIVREIVLDAFWRNEIMSDVATALLEREW